MVIAVFALVGALDVAEVSGSSIVGDGALGDTRDGGGVVRAVVEGGVSDVVVFCHEHDLAEQTGVFEVAVGDNTRGVVSGDELGLDFLGKRETPDVG